MADDWSTIESDPGIFTEILENIGCKHVELEELWSTLVSCLYDFNVCFCL